MRLSQKKMRKLEELNLKNQRVLLRCDFNVPLSKNEPRNSGVKLKMRTKFSSPEGLWTKRTSSSSLPSFPSETKVLDDFRIKETIPTINYLLEKGAKVVLMSHLGRPGGKKKKELSLAPVQNSLTEHLDLSVTLAPDCIGSKIEKWTKEMQEGEILLLENLRFHKEEEGNDDNFAESLSKLGDVYVNDAFGVCHREHASVVGVPKYLPSVAGLLLEKEVKILSDLMKKPAKPLVVVIGGAKVKTKTKLINKLSKVADYVLIGGLIQKEIKAKGISLDSPEKIVAPVDERGGGRDIGEKTEELFREKIALAKTVFFNGVVGQVEEKEFIKGTEEILRAIVKSQAFSVIGGGDLTKVINQLGFADKFGHVSTGGGAMIAFLVGEELPGIKALENAKS